jgi:hypothetical protein
MLIMAEVTSEMGAELRASAMAAGTSVAAEVGRRLDRLARLEEPDGRFSDKDKTGPVIVRSEPLYSGPPNPWDMFRNTSSGR